MASARATCLAAWTFAAGLYRVLMLVGGARTALENALEAAGIGIRRGRHVKLKHGAHRHQEEHETFVTSAARVTVKR